MDFAGRDPEILGYVINVLCKTPQDIQPLDSAISSTLDQVDYETRVTYSCFLYEGVARTHTERKVWIHWAKNLMETLLKSSPFV